MPAATEAEGHAIRHRRRGPALEAAILGAAWDELRTTGYAGFTIDAVARHAGTSRPVLYRRWPNVQAVVAELMTREFGMLTAPLAAGGSGQIRVSVP